MELGNGKHSLGMRVEPGNEANWEVKDIHSPDSLILRLHFPTSLLPTVYVEVADSAPSLLARLKNDPGKWSLGAKLVPHTCILLNH